MPAPAESTVPLHIDILDAGVLRFHDGSPVTAASVIVPRPGSASDSPQWIIGSDDAWTLAVGPLDALSPVVLRDGPRVWPKAQKPDFEAGFVSPRTGRAYLLGSGSTPVRDECVSYSPTGELRVRRLPALYLSLRDRMGWGPGVLNIEGASVDARNDRLWLWHRGNAGPQVPDLRFGLSLSQFEAHAWEGVEDATVLQVGRIEVGNLDGRRLTVSDACGDGESTWIAASAEDSPSTFDDGPCIGSVLARVDASGRIAVLGRFPVAGAKIEGIAVLSRDAVGLGTTLLCVADADDPNVPSPWWRVHLTPGLR